MAEAASLKNRAGPDREYRRPRYWAGAYGGIATQPASSDSIVGSFRPPVIRLLTLEKFAAVCVAIDPTSRKRVAANFSRRAAQHRQV